MKRLSVVFCLLLLVAGMPQIVNASDACKTKYPIVLAHGMGASAEILGILDYWWNIPDGLRKEGATVFTTSVNGMDSTENKALAFKGQLLEILAETGAEKVNIIGHSHGTIYTRYAISNLGLGDRVASYTSLAGPHQGSRLADLLLRAPPWLLDALGDSLDFIYAAFFGDTNPNSHDNFVDVSAAYMQTAFNPKVPNVEGVEYQSHAAKAKFGCPSVILQPSWLVMLALEGANDGLVSVESAKWGRFCGVEDGAWYSPGVDHLNLVGQLFGITPGFDQQEFFREIVGDLQRRGF